MLRRDHSRLDEDDVCIFLGEYQTGGGYAASATNQLILNLKKSVLKKGTPQYPYKLRAIDVVARILVEALDTASLPGWTFVPIPPSKRREHPEYDDRLLRVLERFAKRADAEMDVRELVIRTSDIEASHTKTKNRPRPEEHYATMEIDESVCDPEPLKVILFDDVLSTGSTFKGAKWRLTRRFPGIHIIGMFAARTTSVLKQSTVLP